MDLTNDAIRSQLHINLQDMEPLQAPPAQHEPTQDSVSDHGAAPATTQGGGPTEGAREATKPSRQEIERLAEERAMENPDYAEAKALLEQCKDLEAMFLAIDSIDPLHDKIITYFEVCGLVNDEWQTNRAARDAAKFFKDHPQIWAAISKDDDKVGLRDVQEYLAALKANVRGLKDTARAEVNEELGVKTSSNRTSTQQGAASTTDIPRPAPSTRPGMDGAMENLANVSDWLQSQMMELSKKAAAEPEKAVLYQQQISMLQNQYQAITNMMNQLTQMMSNLSKMWSEVSMNSIRNVK